MTNKCRTLFCSALLLVCFGAQGQNEAKPHRNVKGLPRYMTDIPQPIPDELKLLVAPKTVRDVNCYTSFATSSGMQEVVRKCGIPDEHQGSGIYIFLYDMSDGSVVAIGTSDLKHLMYVNHIQRRSSRSLLQDQSVITPPEECRGCPRIVVRGRLAQILTILECNGNSGMTCHIQFKRGSTLPSRIAVQQLDARGKLIGTKFLPYPDLKTEEKGWATFPFGAAETVVLQGELNGPWRSAY